MFGYFRVYLNISVNIINVSPNLKILTNVMTPDTALEKMQMESLSNIMIGKLKDKYQKVFKETNCNKCKINKLPKPEAKLWF